MVSRANNPCRFRNLVATKSEKPMASQTKWHRDCDLDEKEIDWEKTVQLPRTCTKSTKLIIFQFKFLHRRLPTNSFLPKIVVKESDLFTFCKEEMQGDFRFLGILFPMATILLFNSEGKSSRHDHCSRVETGQLKH